MKTKEFENTIHNIPRQKAVFKLIKPIAWAPELKVGDLLWADNESYTLHSKSGCSYGIGASYIKFVKYEILNQSWLKTCGEKI